MNEKFLLYIDILGFSDLVKINPGKIKLVYEVIDSLNVNWHEEFQTIVFSDTILVYNKCDISSLNNKEYVVLYLIKFVQDLIFKSLVVDFNFRAIITYGEFEHYKLEYTECYYGKALVNAYNYEKEINGIGLFIDSEINIYNRYFKPCLYNEKLYFIFLFQDVLRLINITDGELPIPNKSHEFSDSFPWLEDEISILRKYYIQQHKHELPKVRSKYLQTYHFYRNLMPNLFQQLESTNFSMNTICPEINWKYQ